MSGWGRGLRWYDGFTEIVMLRMHRIIVPASSSVGWFATITQGPSGKWIATSALLNRNARAILA